MSLPPAPPKPGHLSDPVFRAAQHVAAHGEGWTKIGELPEGEVIWREGSDQVRLTPDGWLIYLHGGKVGLYAKRLRATLALINGMRGAAKVERAIRRAGSPSDPRV